MGKRRTARELALQFLYGWYIRGGDLDEALAGFDGLKQKSEDVSQYACELIRGPIETKKELDQLIGRYCTNWNLERIALVDRSVLRIALYEMIHRNDIPPIVAINEAVDIAKKYSTAESGGFVNGILDRIRRDLASEKGLCGSDKEGS